MAGLPKSYIKKYGISKKAWREYHKKKKPRSRKVTKPKKRRRVNRTARRKRKGRRRYSMTIPVAPVLGLVAGMANPIQLAMAGQPELALKDALWKYTGWNSDANKWEWGGMIQGVGPLIAGLLVHKFVGGPPLNLNKILAQSRVPFLRL